jgi:hypothetical protein
VETDETRRTRYQDRAVSHHAFPMPQGHTKDLQPP